MPQGPELKLLHLRAPLCYSPAPLGFPEAGSDASEGEERLFAWSLDAIARMEPDDGPRLSTPLPPPHFSGRRCATGEDETLRLEAGDWIFLQASALDTPETLLEFFLREAWWEREEAEGPLYLRLVREDGKWALQAWRRCAAPS